MNNQIASRWSVAAAFCLFLSGGFCGTLEAQSKQSARQKDANTNGAKQIASKGESHLSIRIKLEPGDSGSIDFNKRFHVVISNRSARPIRVWDPDTKNGYYQLSFRFTNLKTGRVHVARKRQIDDDRFWRLRAPELKTIDIAPNHEFSWQVQLSDSWRGRVWKGLPTPNSSDRFSVSAMFESSVKSLKAVRPVWVGKTQSKKVTANFVASRLKTPHDYISFGFPDRAIEIMTVDPKWIARTEDHRTALHITARKGSIQVVKWLLDN